MPIQLPLSSSQEIKKMLLHLHKDVLRLMSAERKSAKPKREGYDFLGLSEYVHGDDIRSIDWIGSAKLSKPYVKVYQEDKELHIALVALLGSSMDFGVEKRKQEYLSELCATLSFVAVVQKSTFCGYLGSNTLMQAQQKSKTLQDVPSFVSKVATFESFGKKISYEAVSKSLYHEMKEKSLMIFVGDFLDVEIFPLQILLKKHEVLCVVVRDRFDEEPPALGLVNVIDPVSKKMAQVRLSKEASATITTRVREKDALLFGEWKRMGVRSLKLYTDEPILLKLMTFLSH